MSSLIRKLNDECEYILYEVNAEGYLINIEEANVLDKIKELTESNDYTDVIILIHGWNTGYEPNGSLGFGNDIVFEMEQQKARGVKPLYICVKWPSELTRSFGWITSMLFGDPKPTERHNEMMKELLEEKGIFDTDNFNWRNMDACEKQQIFEGAMIHGSSAILTVRNQSASTDTVVRTVKDFSFGQFMRRASNVGSKGVHLLLAHLMRLTPPSVKIHLFGFSMGACVAMAAAIGRAPGSALTRKIHSMFICQGAVPSKSMTEGQQFRPLVSNLKPVAGTIIFTHTQKDTALIAYRVARSDSSGMYEEHAAGCNGIQGTDSSITHECDIRQFPLFCCEVKPGNIYNLSSDMLPGVDHNCYAKPDVIAAFWKGASLNFDESRYQFVDHGSLPTDYWTSYTARTQ